jgi:hypothetical protein
VGLLRVVRSGSRLGGWGASAEAGWAAGARPSKGLGGNFSVERGRVGQMAALAGAGRLGGFGHVAVGDGDTAGDCDRLQHPAIVGD